MPHQQFKHTFPLTPPTHPSLFLSKTHRMRRSQPCDVVSGGGGATSGMGAPSFSCGFNDLKKKKTANFPAASRKKKIKKEKGNAKRQSQSANRPIRGPQLAATTNQHAEFFFVISGSFLVSKHQCVFLEPTHLHLRHAHIGLNQWNGCPAPSVFAEGDKGKVEFLQFCNMTTSLATSPL